MIKNQTTVSVRRQFAKFAIPAVIGMIVNSLYTIVDGIFVGRGVGELALGSINIAFPFIMTQIAISMLIAIGGANLFSMKKGKGENDSANNVFCQSVSLLIIASLILNVFVIIFKEKIGILLGADDSLLPETVNYIKWMAIFGLVFMPGLGISIFVRNDNNPALEMIGTICGALVNIFLDYLFIMRLGLGVTGAAVASGIGQSVSALIYLIHFFLKKNTLKIRFPVFKLAELTKIIYNGFASFLMEFSQSIITFSFNLAIMAKLGNHGVSAYSIVMYICSISNMALIGIVQGAQPILSFSRGSGDTHREKAAYKLGVKTNIVLIAIFYILILIFGKQLCGIFISDNPALTDLSMEMISIYFLGFFPIGVTLMNILYFQTTESEAKSNFISVLRCVGFVQLSLLILPNFLGTVGIYASLLVGELLNCLCSALLMRQDRLKQTKAAPVPQNSPNS